MIISIKLYSDIFKTYYGIIKSVTYDHGRKNSLPKLRKGHMIWNCNLVLLCPL